MTRRNVTAVGLIAAIVLAAAYIGYLRVLGPRTVSAYFTSATAIYPGDEVRVAGVKVGTISTIEPEGTTTKVVMRVQRNVPVPENAEAIIVAQSLVAARYVQLTPPYQSGPTIGADAVIPLDRTAIPVEWDEVKVQLTKLATQLGPTNGVSSSSVGRFIDSAANALDGNGDKLRTTLAQLSGTAKILADGSGDIVTIIDNLQTFITALKDSGEQIVQFEDRFATLTSVLDDSTTDLDAALTNLSSAVGDVQRFVADNRDRVTEQVQRLASATQVLVDHRLDLEQVLHVAPTGMANFMNIYNPDQGTVAGSFVLNNFSNPMALVCSGIGGIANVTAPEAAKLCAQYLGPALSAVSLNGLPFPVNPFLGPTARPENLIYTEPELIPGAGPPIGDTPPTDVADMLLPAEQPPPPPSDGSTPP